MTRTPDSRRVDYTQPIIAQSSRAQQHVWDDPLPGQGTMQQCRKCGERKKAPAMNEACAGITQPEPGVTHDYNPHA